ncbi:MAG: hypothetical protein GWN71_24800 [Gammaproteobacteria bacterium]|nr:hypothetical protein [Gammaproteobacteria bacterium]
MEEEGMAPDTAMMMDTTMMDTTMEGMPEEMMEEGGGPEDEMGGGD